MTPRDFCKSLKTSNIFVADCRERRSKCGLLFVEILLLRKGGWNVDREHMLRKKEMYFNGSF
jgi:hypothetical protein